MPIRSDLRHFYGPQWKHVTRPLILARAGGKITGPDSGPYVYHGGAHCEQCGRPDRTTVELITVKDLEAGHWYMLWRPTAGASDPWAGPALGIGKTAKRPRRRSTPCLRTARNGAGTSGPAKP